MTVQELIGKLEELHCPSGKVRSESIERDGGATFTIGKRWLDEIVRDGGDCATLSTGRSHWHEPLENWILCAKNAGEIAVSGSLQEKGVLARHVFGSNLVLDGQEARGSCVKQWSFLTETAPSDGSGAPARTRT